MEQKMKQTLKLLSAITLLSIAGCQFTKTPSSSIGAWEKPGADFTEVAKALLECGMPTPYDKDPESSATMQMQPLMLACFKQDFAINMMWGEAGVEIIKPKTCPFVVQVLSYHSAVSRSA